MFSKLILGAWLLVQTIALQAAAVTYNFNGSLLSSSSSYLSAGDAFSINISWDTNATATSITTYEALTSITGSIGAYSISGTNDLSLLPTTSNAIIVSNDDDWDTLTFVAALETLPDAKLGSDLDIKDFLLSLSDYSSTVFNDNSLVDSVTLDDFDSNFLTMHFLDGTDMFANVTEVSKVATVPVPASVWLFISGLLGLLSLQRKTILKIKKLGNIQ